MFVHNMAVVRAIHKKQFFMECFLLFVVALISGKAFPTMPGYLCSISGQIGILPPKVLGCTLFSKKVFEVHLEPRALLQINRMLEGGAVLYLIPAFQI